MVGDDGRLRISRLLSLGCLSTAGRATAAVGELGPRRTTLNDSCHAVASLPIHTQRVSRLEEPAARPNMRAIDFSQRSRKSRRVVHLASASFTCGARTTTCCCLSVSPTSSHSRASTSTIRTVLRFAAGVGQRTDQI
jgi:hypothetical protein